MSVASELHTSLRTMGFVQLLLAIVFLACYSIACSTLFETRGRARAGLVALLAAAGFIAFTQPWVHGALLLAGAVAGMGLFSISVWVLSTGLQLRQRKALVLVDAAPAAEPVALAPQARPEPHDGVHAA